MKVSQVSNFMDRKSCYKSRAWEKVSKLSTFLEVMWYYIELSITLHV
jgi:hypothetical protein